MYTIKCGVIMDDNQVDVANNLIDKIGVDPCLLSIVIIVIGFLVFMTITVKEKEKIERERVKDALNAVERIIGNGK
jgi:hypothetical protein